MKGLEEIALDGHRSDVRKETAIIQSVKDQLGIVNGVRELSRKSVSGESCFYDPTREHQWRISKMVTQPSVQGPNIFTSLHTPLSAISNTPLVDTQSIPFANQMLEVCFEHHDDHLCL